MYQMEQKNADIMNAKNVGIDSSHYRRWRRFHVPDCEAEIDYEIGPDESMEDILDTAQLLQKIEGEEEIEKMDALLSLAITGGDCNWI